MAANKADVLRQGNVSNQQALVNLLMDQTVKPVKRVIPGGQHMLKQLDQPSLENAIYNWLRGTRFFEAVTVSLAKDPEKFRLREVKVVDFPADQQYPIWVTHQEGKKYLARLMADFLKKNQLVTLRVDKSGLYMSKDTDNEFGPTREATQADVELAAENLKEGETLTLGVGDPIQSEDWEPYVEFIPSGKSRYGR